MIVKKIKCLFLHSNFWWTLAKLIYITSLLLACDCNEFGSMSTNCDPLTGQCPCKDKYVGRTCSQCKVTDHNKFPWCSGYHICLTRRWSPVRSRAETFLLYPVKKNLKMLANHKTNVINNLENQSWLRCLNLFFEIIVNLWNDSTLVSL